jgi:adenylate cyclase
MRFLPHVPFLGLNRAAEAEPPLPRVQALVSRQEVESERLIGWVQLGVVFFFGLLWAIAPRPADATLFQPVPVALAFYLAFTTIRLVLSYVTVLPGWLLFASMVIDVGMLLGLIWSFHIQYGQPAAFYLKIPTFTYIFVFIALRALRFDARFVLGTGILAAAGWLAMVLYAVRATGPAGITRSFVDYLNSSRILIGAEVDKIVAILVVTAILALAIRRAGHVLNRSIREEVRTRDMIRFLPRDVADVITSAEHMVRPGDAEEREAAVLLLDLRGFTRFCAGKPPRDVVELLVGFHKRIVPIVTGYRGVVDKYLGDGVMATFGAAHASPTAAADALQALDAIVAEARDWRASFSQAEEVDAPLVNGSVTAGPVVFAALGDEERLEYTIIGEAVNLATKIEKHNKAEGTVALTTLAAYERAASQGYRRQVHPEILEGRKVAGVEEPIDLVVVAR